MHLCNSSVEPAHHSFIVNQAPVLSHNFSEFRVLRLICSLTTRQRRARALRQPDPGGGVGGGGAFCSGGRPTYLPVSVIITLIM